MNDKHKKLIEDAAKEYHADDGPQFGFYDGASYILDNLQLFGLVEQKEIDDFIKIHRFPFDKKELTEYGQGADAILNLLTHFLELKLKKDSHE